MRRRGLGSLLFVLVLTVGSLAYTFIAGNAPFLGLDLQGGVAVVLQPDGDATDEQLEDAVSILRSRVDAIGVAEPEITRRGQSISVEIPGLEDSEQAIELVGQTGELRFRPVLRERQTGVPVDEDGEPLFGDGADIELEDDAEDTGDSDSEADEDTEADAQDDDEGALGPFAPGEAAMGAQGESEEDQADSEEAGTDELDDLAPEGLGADLEELTPEELQELDIAGELDEQLLEEFGEDALQAASNDLDELTPAEEDLAEDEVVLARYESMEGQRFEIARYLLGPTALTGAGLEDARATIATGQWSVHPTFRPGEEGIDAFNAQAQECFSQMPSCPAGLLAITLDSEVISALSLSTPTFARDQIQITGNFTEDEAKDLATILRFGALPVELEIEAVQDVSASIGRDALQAGLVAGGIGLALVALYMIAFYRLLGVTAVLKLVIEGALLWSIVAWLGSTQGLALTLAGVTGMIVAIGLSVDSNVVFFEHVKEDIRNGRSARSAARRSFAGAWRTIVKADVATLIAAVLLYALAVGPVRGLAFYLGLATILNLAVAWLFMRPAVGMVLRSRACERNPGRFGLPPLRSGSASEQASAGVAPASGSGGEGA